MSEIQPNHSFTQEEVNALVPKIEEHLENFWAWRQNAQEILQELRKFTQNGDLTQPSEIAHHQIRQAQARFLLELAQKEMKALFDLGGQVKDIEIGLMDFFSKINDEEIFLCWKYGEKKVRHWHKTDEGYSERKLIDRK